MYGGQFGEFVCGYWSLNLGKFDHEPPLAANFVFCFCFCFVLFCFFLLVAYEVSLEIEESYLLHGKTGNSGWNIKWFTPFCLGSVRKFGL